MTIEICTCHYKENLEWLKESPWPVTVVHKEGGDPVTLEKAKMYTIPNIGAETTAYLYYIIKNYDALPDYVAFIHGHETSYHQKGDRHLLHMIRDANIQKYDFLHLNNAWRCVNVKYQLGRMFDDFETFSIDTIDNFFIVCCGAQFIVSKSRILQHKKEYYEKLYSLIKDKETPVFFEIVMFQKLFLNTFSCVPHEDDFNPQLKEILYSSSNSFSFDKNIFRIGYVGKNFPKFLKYTIHIDSKELWDYYHVRCTTFVIFKYDQIAFNGCDDLGKICVIHCEDVHMFMESIFTQWNVFVKVYEDSIHNNVSPGSDICRRTLGQDYNSAD